MLAEGAGVTDVVDALDPGSMWSLRFTAGYQRTMRNAVLQRERSPITTNSATSPSATGTTEFDNLARFEQITQTLNLGLELAIWHDLSLYVGAPIILSDTRSLTAHSDVSPAQQGFRTADGYGIINPDGSTTAGSLFSVPFRSPERSGIDFLRIGLMWDILNQARDPHLPTWLVKFEWRLPVGAPLQPCFVDAAGATQCPQPLGADGTAGRPSNFMDGTNNVTADATHPYQRPMQTNPDPGISRRVHGLYFQTMMSRRIGYIEPYGGLDAMLEIPAGDLPQFRFGDTPYGQLATYPPIQGSFFFGAEIIPWENRETWQRFAIDLNIRGSYYSQGRDYSLLYDALGTSNSVPLTTPQYPINQAVVGGTQNPVYFTGTTGVHSHGAITGGLGIAIQPAKFLRFAFGGSVMYTTPFIVTGTDACNPNVDPVNHPEYRAGCVGNSVPDPQHHTVIDGAGQRFRFTDDWTWNIYVNLALTPRF
ncbi:MAG: hypothetical protein WCJ30_19970 [Deltaproteobacteria bacterium]